MQGWDSVEIKSDVELGGTEQLFSLLVARDLQQSQGLAGQVAITMPILVGTDGVRKMGKSLSNYIGVNEPADTQFGKVMSLPDAPMRQYFTLLTDLPLSEVDRLLGTDINPRDAKEVLGKAVVAQYHGSEAGEAAAETFRNRAKGLEQEIKSGSVFSSQLDFDHKIVPGVLLKHLGLASSTSEGNRLVEQGAVKVGPERTPLPRDRNAKVEVVTGLIVTVGSGNANCRTSRIRPRFTSRNSRPISAPRRFTAWITNVRLTSPARPAIRHRVPSRSCRSDP
jgi:tyrosyl-tRNA synthetase